MPPRAVAPRPWRKAQVATKPRSWNRARHCFISNREPKNPHSVLCARGATAHRSKAREEEAGGWRRRARRPPPRALSLNRQGGRRADWADRVFQSDGGLRRWRLKATFHLYCFYISRPSPPNEKIKPLTRQLTSTFYEQTEVSFFPSTLHRGTEDSQGQNLGTGPQPTSVGAGAA